MRGAPQRLENGARTTKRHDEVGHTRAWRGLETALHSRVPCLTGGGQNQVGLCLNEDEGATAPPPELRSRRRAIVLERFAANLEAAALPPVRPLPPLVGSLGGL